MELPFSASMETIERSLSQLFELSLEVAEVGSVASIAHVNMNVNTTTQPNSTCKKESKVIRRSLLGDVRQKQHMTKQASSPHIVSHSDIRVYSLKTLQLGNYLQAAIYLDKTLQTSPKNPPRLEKVRYQGLDLGPQPGEL